MSRDFKSKFDEMQGNLSENPESENAARYTSPGNVRNICFAWPDGKKQYFNYAYLVTSEFSPEEGSIRLEFTTHTILIKGINLETLYFEIFDQHARIIASIDKRYEQLTESVQTIIHEIIITPNSG